MRNSITFKKMLLLFCAVATPLFGFSFFLIHRNNAAEESRILSSVQEKTDQTASTLASAIEQLYHTASRMAEQSNLRRLADTGDLMSPYDISRNILLLQEQQTSIKNANQYVDNFIIYYEKFGKAYNSAGDGVPSFFEFSPEDYRILTDAYAAGDFLALYNGSLTGIVVPSSKSGFLIRMDFSTDALTKMLTDAFSEYEPYYTLTLFDGRYHLTNLPSSLQEAAEMPSPLTDSSPEVFWQREKLDGQTFYRFSAPLPYGDGFITYLFSRNQLLPNSRFYQSIPLYFFFFALGSCYLFIHGSYSLIQRPIRMLIESFQAINRQNYSIRLPEKQNSDFSYLYREFNHMAGELERLIERVYRQQLLLKKAELKQLQAQINPHFLYNSFFLLRRMIQDELYEEAEKMTDTLGMYFQYITRNSQEQIPLSMEYRHAMLYCEIQQLRFEGRVSILTDPLPAAAKGLLVPKLILQPLLENAFNYGLKNKVENGILRVSVREEGDGLTILVEDNGEELTDSGLAEIQKNLRAATDQNPFLEMTGILNIQRRLCIFSDRKSRLEAERSSLGGLCIRLHLTT